MTQNLIAVTRRRIIKTIAAAGALAAGSGVATADGRTEPPKNAPSSRVSPWPGISEVPVGNWIIHRISINAHWGPGEDFDTQKDAMNWIENFLNVADCDASIDGDQVADPNDHWTEPVVHETEQFVETEWRYVTPPKGLGEKYVYRFAFHQPFDVTLPDDALDEGQDPENVEIVKGSRGNGNGNY